jgi:DNA polymerase-4
VVLPGYEASFLGRQPVSFLPDLPPHLEASLREAGIETLGQLSEVDTPTLAAAVGSAVAPRLQEAARGAREEPIAVTAPPLWIQEETRLRDSRNDREALLGLVGALAARACRRLRPFGLSAESLAVEVRRAHSSKRRSETLQPGVADEATTRRVASSLAGPLLEPVATVRAIQVRLSRLTRPDSQARLFPAGAAR